METSTTAVPSPESSWVRHRPRAEFSRMYAGKLAINTTNRQAARQASERSGGRGAAGDTRSRRIAIQTLVPAAAKAAADDSAINVVFEMSRGPAVGQFQKNRL